MKTKSFLATGVLCVATIGGLDVSGGVQAPEFGIRAAQARDDYTGTRSGRTGRLIAGTPGVQDKAVAEPWRDRLRTRAARKVEAKRERAAPAKFKPSAAERRQVDEEAASADARPVQAAEPSLPVAVQPDVPMPEPSDLLTALQRKARAIAAEEAREEASRITGSVSPVGAAPSMRSAEAAKPIRSVTLDYESGIRTTIFQDGTIEEEEVALRP